LSDPTPRLSSVRHLAALVGVSPQLLRELGRNAVRHYDPFTRVNKSGKRRNIDNPRDPLKGIQRRVLSSVLSRELLPEYVMGGVPGRSARANALVHVGQRAVVKMDIRDFFPNIRPPMVLRALIQQVGCGRRVAELLTQLTTFRYRLPQGAPTSAMLANLVALPMACELNELATSLKLRFTIYVDDITFSGDGAHEALGTAIEIVQRHGFAVRSKKVTVARSNAGQVVTGITVNRGVGVPREKRKAIRQRMRHARGVDHTTRTQERRSIEGLIAHVRWINPRQGESLERAWVKGNRAVNETPAPGSRRAARARAARPSRPARSPPSPSAPRARAPR